MSLRNALLLGVACLLIGIAFGWDLRWAYDRQSAFGSRWLSNFRDRWRRRIGGPE